MFEIFINDENKSRKVQKWRDQPLKQVLNFDSNFELVN